MTSFEGRIAVVGSGANGSSIGADLIDSGHDVTLVEQWPAHVEAMRSEGLRIEMADGALHVRPEVIHLCQVAELRHPFDLVLIVMKAYDTRWAAQLIAPYVSPTGRVVALQNGMTTQAVADATGQDRAVAAVIEVSSTMTEPGIVHRHTSPERSWFALDSSVSLDAVAEVLQHSGTVARFDDIQSAKWMKLVSNASVLVPTASLGLPMLDAIAVPGMRELMVEAGKEALAVGSARGHGVLPLFGLAPEDLVDTENLVETMLDVLYDRFVVPGATTTVLQDWRKGRHSEVDDVNGLIVAEGRRLGIDTPANARIVAAARRIERGEAAPGTDRLADLIG